MSITITTWNVQNFTKNSVEFDEKLDFLVRNLEMLGSDVIALQEILDDDVTESLANILGFHFFNATPDDRGNRVAFLTRNAPVQPKNEIIEWQIPKDEEIRRFDSNGDIVVDKVFPRPALHITVYDRSRG